MHHPIWDYDMSSAPILADINVNGRADQGGGGPTKQGWLYVFDRVTGQPVWPIEEKPVPQSRRAGREDLADAAVPDQAAGAMRATTCKVPDDLIDFTPELRQQALDYLKRYKVGHRRSRRASLGDANGILGAIVAGTATNWPGGGLRSRDAHRLHAGRQHAGRALAGRAARRFSDIRYVQGIAGQPFRDSAGPRRLLRRRRPADRGTRARWPALRRGQCSGRRPAASAA